jgi:hypothetical protein
MCALCPRKPFPLPVACVFLAVSCSPFQEALAPALPFPAEMPAPGQIPDSVLREAIRRSDLIVLATPVELASLHGILTPHFQLGAKETWYEVKLAVDSVFKGKLKGAKRTNYGILPAALTPPSSFGRLAANEIIVQYPAVTSRSSEWAAAAPLVPGEQAVFIFRRCYYCLPISGLAHGRGPYYKADPLIAIGRASKLPPDEWPRVVRLLAEHRRRRSVRARHQYKPWVLGAVTEGDIHTEAGTPTRLQLRRADRRESGFRRGPPR